MNASFIAQRYIDSILYVAEALKQSCVKPPVSCQLNVSWYVLTILFATLWPVVVSWLK